MQARSAFVLLAGFVLHVGGTVGADDAYYRVPVKELKLTDGVLPDWGGAPESTGAGSWRRRSSLEPRAVLEGAGEVCFQRPEREASFLEIAAEGAIVVRVPEPREVKGRVYLPNADWSGLVGIAFTIEPSAASPDAKLPFFKTKHAHYEGLAAKGSPGAAWFRHQADEARREVEKLEKPKEQGRDDTRLWWRRPRASELEETYSVFTGGRALSENLQLDRLLPPVKAGDLTVDASTLPGITVAALDWKPLVKDLKPAVDPLAALIPADQHAIFFPSFRAMIDLMDEADAHGTPVLALLEPRAEDARTRERYEKQLSLGMSDLARLLGPAVVASAAFTGSDPYLRVGSDVAVLFEARAPEILKGYIASKHAAALKAEPSAKASQGEVEGVSYSAVVSPDRAVSSYMASHGSTVIVTNSLVQLRRLAEAAKGKTAALASSDEYVFFRDRYPRGDKDETALLILTDATIRRWCGPIYRIADSRRTRAAAALTELAARQLDDIVKGAAREGPIETALSVPEAGPFRMTPRGPVSEAYGSLDFMTPIAELSIVKVTKEEATAYERFRQSYQENWRRFFDPIAVRFVARPDRLAADLTVMPLIEGTEYRQFMDVTRGSRIGPADGDPHTEAILHVAVAIDTESQTIRGFSNFAAGMVPALKANPLGWLGSSVALYAEDDPIWGELRRDKDGVPRVLEKKFPLLPIALHFEVKDPLGLTVFLAALRGFIEQTAPGMTSWEALVYKEKPYVKVSPSAKAKSEGQIPREAQEMAVHYAASGGALVVTLNEPLLRRALDRQLERKGPRPAGDEPGTNTNTDKGTDTPKPIAGEAWSRPWLGSNLAARADRRALDAFALLLEDEYRAANQQKSWDNLPILNEWRRRFPAEDPVKLHERLWQAKLLCPGGGAYGWSEEFQTMESAAYGHPGKPRAGPDVPLPLAGISAAAFGLTFEKDGLRARAEIERKPAKP